MYINLDIREKQTYMKGSSFITIMIVVRVIGVLDLLLSHLGGILAQDPCIDHAILDEPKRSVEYTLGYNETEICDRFIVEGWYRVAENGTIPTSCPEISRCGTMFPIWLQGTIPGRNQVGTIQACSRGLQKLDCCVSSHTIEVKNCVSFLVYHLITPPSCPGRYCVDGHIAPCPEGESSDSGFVPCKQGLIPSVHISNKSLIAYEGGVITIQCKVKSVALSDSVKITWRLDNAEIKPTRNSRIQTQYEKVGPMTYTSSLTIKNAVSETDEGYYSCAARLGDEEKNDSAKVEIYGFDLKTNATAVFSSTTVSVNCTLLPYRNDVYEILQMCKNGNVIKASSIINNTAVLNVNNLMSDVVVSCGWKKTNDCNKHKSVRISVVQPKYIPCNKTASNNITWEKTFPGHVDYQECLSGFLGQASRLCKNVNFEGEWMEPSFINCTRKRIAEVIIKLNRIKDGVGVESLVTVLREFKNENKKTSINNDTQPSDLKSSVEILEKVSEIVSNREKDLTQEETKEFILATDALLSINNREAWNNLNNEITDNSAARVMDVVSTISRTALKTLNKPVVVNGENIVLKIEKKNISDITFPEINTTSELQDIASRIIFSEKTIKKSLNDIKSFLTHTIVYLLISFGFYSRIFFLY